MIKYYENPQGEVFGYGADQGTLIDQAITAGMVEITGSWPPAPTPAEVADQIRADLTLAVQAHLDATAGTRNYDGILSLCSYAASTSPKFGLEGLAGVAWRDAVWAACYSIMAEVQAGTRAVPTADDLMAELPAMVWPA